MGAEYTVDGFDQETIDERIAALLELWGTQADEDAWDYDEEALHIARQRAFELAVSEPSEIETDLFIKRTILDECRR